MNLYSFLFRELIYVKKKANNKTKLDFRALHISFKKRSPKSFNRRQNPKSTGCDYTPRRPCFSYSFRSMGKRLFSGTYRQIYNGLLGSARLWNK